MEPSQSLSERGNHRKQSLVYCMALENTNTFSNLPNYLRNRAKLLFGKHLGFLRNMLEALVELSRSEVQIIYKHFSTKFLSYHIPSLHLLL